MTKAIDLTGEKYNMLTVIRLARVSDRGFKIWLCLCDCGNEKELYGTVIKSGKTKSCGCLTRHGMTGTPIYLTWKRMFKRCYSIKDVAYPNYGGRGIKVCERWSEKYSGFPNFYNDMGDIPEGMSLDRIDVNGDYSPENCRWATKSVQSYNQRVQKRSKSGKTGVREFKGRWVANIQHEGERIFLGSFETFEEAATARNEAELYYFGVAK